jgi:hypothetical protein
MTQSQTLLPYSTPNPQLKSEWNAPPGTRTHSDGVNPPDAIFFVPPPAEIGEVTSAESTISLSKPPRKINTRLLITGLVAGPFAALAAFGLLKPSNAALAWGIILFFLFGTIVWFGTKTPVYCSYVGRLGAARFKYRGPNKAASFVQILFPQAVELRSGATRHYTNGIYTGTSYTFVWTDTQGRTLCSLAGQHKGKNGLPKAKDKYHFGHAAEIAWTEFLFDRAADELARNGAITFNITSNKSVGIGPGFIEFHWRGNPPQRFEAGEIGKLDLSEGMFRVHHKDAKWYSTTGKYAFAYAQMANARMFLIALDRFLNVPSG